MMEQIMTNPIVVVGSLVMLVILLIVMVAAIRRDRHAWNRNDLSRREAGAIKNALWTQVRRHDVRRIEELPAGVADAVIRRERNRMRGR